MPRGSAFPRDVPSWLMLGDEGTPRIRHRLRVLDVGSGRGAMAQLLADEGADVTCLDQDEQRASRLAARRTGLRAVAGQVESLPFDACRFELVTAVQNLHRFAPGLAFAELARVLVPEGQLAIVYNTRDDTVPWVRKLGAILQAADPTAMLGDYGADSLDQLAASPFFDEPVRHDFRHWVPITRPALLAMVADRPGIRRLGADERQRVAEEVGALYETYARVPEPLLLPFRTSCWRARVDHTELSLVDPVDALQIPLGF